MERTPSQQPFSLHHIYSSGKSLHYPSLIFPPHAPLWPLFTISFCCVHRCTIWKCCSQVFQIFSLPPPSFPFTSLLSHPFSPLFPSPPLLLYFPSSCLPIISSLSQSPSAFRSCFKLFNADGVI